MFEKFTNLNLKCFTLVNRLLNYSEWLGETKDGQIIFLRKHNNLLAGGIGDCEIKAKTNLVILHEGLEGNISIDWLIKFFKWKVEDEIFDPTN